MVGNAEFRSHYQIGFARFIKLIEYNTLKCHEYFKLNYIFYDFSTNYQIYALTSTLTSYFLLHQIKTDRIDEKGIALMRATNLQTNNRNVQK